MAPYWHASFRQLIVRLINNPIVINGNNICMYTHRDVLLYHQYRLGIAINITM